MTGNSIKKIYESVTKFCFRYRIAISSLAIAGILWEDFNEHLVPRDLLDPRDYLGMGGIILVLGGAFLRSWAAGVVKKGQELARTGPYSLTRHPLYTGSLAIALGFCFILWDDENIFVILLLAVLIYVPKIFSEEKVLGSRFRSEYADYKNRTGLFYPKSMPDLKSKWSFSQWCHNKEYQAFSLSLLGLTILQLAHEIGMSFHR